MSLVTSHWCGDVDIRGQIVGGSEMVYSVACGALCAVQNLVQCTVSVSVYSAKLTVLRIQCSVYSAQFTLLSIQCSVYTPQYTVLSIHCTVYSAECTVQSVHL